MVNETVIKKGISESRGFSLLEIIFVLAFLGILLLAVGKYVRKLIDDRYRQATADAVAQEVYGVLQFVNTDTIEVVNNVYRERVTNPLYQTPDTAVYPDAKTGAQAALKGLANNPVWLSHPNATKTSLDATQGSVSPYIARNYSTSLTSPISNSMMIGIGGNTYYSHSLKWSQAIWGPDSVRHYFTDSGCAGNGGAVYFKQQFLSCNENPALSNSEIVVSRIDLINDKGSVSRITTNSDTVSVNRVDVYVSFTPVDGNPARLEQFITPLMTAFRLKKITPNTNNVYLVMQSSSNSWTLLNKTNGRPAGNNTVANSSNLALFTDLPQLVGKLQKNHTYAIRFSFDGNGDYLRTDGLNAATKLCWNTTAGAAGPCLISPSEELLVLNQRKDSQEKANLQVNSVISAISYTGVDGKTIVEDYYTAPYIQYKTFSSAPGSHAPVPYYRHKTTGPDGKPISELCTSKDNCGVTGVDSDDVVEEANGAIAIPLQTCPKMADGKDMFPRLSASVSSVISGLPIDDSKLGLAYASDIFHNQDSTLLNLNDTKKAQISINKLGGVVIQITQKNKQWRLSSFVGTQSNGNDKNPQAWQYYNPPWLSVMVSTWCSSIKQD